MYKVYSLLKWFIANKLMTLLSKLLLFVHMYIIFTYKRVVYTKI